MSNKSLKGLAAITKGIGAADTSDTPRQRGPLDPPVGPVTRLNPSETDLARQQAMQDFQEGRRKGPGRPPGKRSDPNYETLTVLVHKDTRYQADLMLLQQQQQPEQNGPKDLSELVDTLLRSHFRNQGPAKPGN